VTLVDLLLTIEAEHEITRKVSRKKPFISAPIMETPLIFITFF
jgi:hypothetical protein